VDFHAHAHLLDPDHACAYLELTSFGEKLPGNLSHFFSVGFPRGLVDGHQIKDDAPGRLVLLLGSTGCDEEDNDLETDGRHVHHEEAGCGLAEYEAQLYEEVGFGLDILLYLAPLRVLCGSRLDENHALCCLESLEKTVAPTEGIQLAGVACHAQEGADVPQQICDALKILAKSDFY
jgi:hypothetical protein